MYPMRLTTSLIAAALLLTSVQHAHSQSYANPFRAVDGWAKPPAGREMGRVGDVEVDPDGKHIWAIVRCDPTMTHGRECIDSDLDPVIKFDPDGNAVKTFGGGMFIWPHGMDIEPDDNIWVTDAIREEWTPSGKRGHQVVKFSPEGEVLMRLGRPGVAGNDSSHFNSPTDVVVARNDDVFVTDGHAAESNNRVVKFSKDGTYIKEWGGTGYAAGQLRLPHTIAIDSRGRIFVGDRENARIQIFDQDGNHIAIWRQFGRPSGIAFDKRGSIYVADSTSDDEKNPGFAYGIRIGDSERGWIRSFIQYPWGDPRVARGHGTEWVAVDAEGNLYGGEPYPRNIQKYVRVMP